VSRPLPLHFLLVFHSNYGSILHQFQDKARYWSKIVIFFIYTPLHSTPTLGGGGPVWCRQTRMVGLPDGKENSEDMYINRLDTIPACDGQTDGRSDGQTSSHGIVRAMHTRRAVKIIKIMHAG